MVQTKRAEINSDTAVSITHHHRPGYKAPGQLNTELRPRERGSMGRAVT